MSNELELGETRRVIEEVNDLILSMWRRHMRVLDPLAQSEEEPETSLAGPQPAGAVIPSPDDDLGRSQA